MWMLSYMVRRQRPLPPQCRRSEWAWHDVGEFDFAELQKIPRPTMDGLCLYIQGDVEIAEIEIEKTK